MDETAIAPWERRFAPLSDLEIATIIDRVAVMPYAIPREAHAALCGIVRARNLDVLAVLREHERATRTTPHPHRLLGL